MMTGNDVWLNAAIHLYENKIAEPILWLGDDCHLIKARDIFGEAVLSMNDFVHYQQNIQEIFIIFLSRRKTLMLKEIR